MSTHIHTTQVSDDQAAAPVQRAYRLLYYGFTILPLVFGLDKFTHYLVDWNMYLSPALARFFPGDPDQLLKIIGLVEVALGVLVAVKPKAGGYGVAAFFLSAVANLLSIPAHYDTAIADFGLALAALALARLAETQERLS